MYLETDQLRIVRRCLNLFKRVHLDYLPSISLYLLHHTMNNFHFPLIYSHNLSCATLFHKLFSYVSCNIIDTFIQFNRLDQHFILFHCPRFTNVLFQMIIFNLCLVLFDLFIPLFFFRHFLYHGMD